MFYKKKIPSCIFAPRTGKIPQIRPFQANSVANLPGENPPKFQIDFFLQMRSTEYLFEHSFELRRPSTFEWLMSQKMPIDQSLDTLSWVLCFDFTLLGLNFCSSLNDHLNVIGDRSAVNIHV